MVSADRERVPVPHDGDDLHIRTSDLQTGGEGQGPSMGGMECVEIQVDRHAGRAADARHQGDIVILQAQPVDRADQCSHGNADAAAGTPDGGEFLILAEFLEGLAALEPVLRRHLTLARVQAVGFSQDIVHACASIASRIIWGVIISPFARVTRLTFFRPTIRSTS